MVIRDLFKLIRPLNVLLTFVSVWLAAFISPQFKPGISVLLAALSASLILAGANIINDLYDLEIDKLNRPNRPLAAGLISQRTGWFYFYLFYLGGLACALSAGPAFFYIAGLIALLLVWYSARLKRTVLWGNILVSFAGGLTFIYGALAVGDWQSGIIPAIFAYFFHFGREVIKDVQDLPGDLENQVVTFPGKFGVKAAILLVNILFTILILLTILPYIFSVYSNVYLWVVVLGVDSVLLYIISVLWIRQEQAAFVKLSALLKVDMFVGLIAILLGARHVTFFN